MKLLLCDLLLLSLVSSSSGGDCRGDCLACGERLRPAPDAFSLEVCVLECEGQLLASPLWTPCAKAMARGSWRPGPADPEQAAAALAQPGASDTPQLKRMPRVRSVHPAQAQPGAPARAGEAAQPEQKQLQKRFGGFTGARKSARKLANQKRFSEFMRQYLVLSLQSSQRRRTLRPPVSG